jgi:hypothetical protein
MMMKILASFLAVGLMTSSALAADFKNVAVVDVACSKKVAADADSHTRDCALMCEKSGFAIVTDDKKVLKFDASGNAKVLEQLKASEKADHLRVNVTGDVDGDTIKVTSVKLL